MKRMKANANNVCSDHDDYRQISNGKSEKALPLDHVKPKWPTPTMLRR